MAWTSVGSLSYSQEIRVADEAIERAAPFCQAIGRHWTHEFATAKKLEDTWQVEDHRDGLVALIDAETGACGAFIDHKLSDEIYRRKNRQSRSLPSQTEAWETGEATLRFARNWDNAWVRGELRPLADQPGADSAKDAHSDRYTLEWLKKDSRYPGAYGRATMTLDLVTGRPVMFTVNVLQFEHPARILSRDEAVEKVRRLWSAEYLRLKNAGYAGEAELFYGGVGEQHIRSGLVLQVRDDGKACFGSGYGERLATEGKARLCWVFGKKGTEIAIDAESGEPFSGGVSKASADSAKRNPPRNPNLPPPAGVMENPLVHGPLPLAGTGLLGFVVGWIVRGRMRR